MRRRRKLEVSTFPFLAVLLCAMGSLILVLLAMDHKAKLAARAKAEMAARKVAEEAELLAAACRAAHEQASQEQRAKWERKRNELHARLESDKHNLEGQMEVVRARLAESAAQLQAEQESMKELEGKAEKEKDKLSGATKLLNERQAAVERVKAASAAQQKALEKMTADLLLLENTLHDLKAARERDRQTYSVVPYKGRRGESRRPLYVECAAGVVIFHPDKVKLTPERADEVRAEVLRRVEHQREIIQTGGGTADTIPYLMLMVRPDGVPTYYLFQAALHGMEIRFGYEFIDADWILDFPADDTLAGTQPWMRKSSDVTPLVTSAKPGTRGILGMRPTAVPLMPGSGGDAEKPGLGTRSDEQSNAAYGAGPHAGGAGQENRTGPYLAGSPSTGTGNGTDTGAGNGTGVATDRGVNTTGSRNGVAGVFAGGSGSGGAAGTAGFPGVGGVPGGSSGIGSDRGVSVPGSGIGSSPSIGSVSTPRGVVGAGPGSSNSGGILLPPIGGTGSMGMGQGQSGLPGGSNSDGGGPMASQSVGSMSSVSGYPGRTGAQGGPTGPLLGAPAVMSSTSNNSGISSLFGMGNGSGNAGVGSPSMLPGTGNGPGNAGGGSSLLPGTGTGSGGTGGGSTLLAGTGNSSGNAGVGNPSMLPGSGNGPGNGGGSGSLPLLPGVGNSLGSSGGGGSTLLAGTGNGSGNAGVGNPYMLPGTGNGPGNGGGGGSPSMLPGTGNGPGNGEGSGSPSLLPGTGTGSGGSGGSSLGAPGGSSSSGSGSDQVGSNSSSGPGMPGQQGGSGSGGPPSLLANAMPRSPLPETGAQPSNGTQPPDGTPPPTRDLTIPPPLFLPGQKQLDQPSTTNPSVRTSAGSGAASGDGGVGVPVGGGLPNQGGGSGDGEIDPLGRYAPRTPPSTTPGPRKPLALRPARLNGDRDYVIYVECRSDSVVLYPSQRIFPLTALSYGGTTGNPLLQAIQQMIDRRQASVPANGVPYRPQVCFLVRSENMRAYHTAYPALDALTIPKVRQNLGPEDDVLAIVTGH